MRSRVGLVVLAALLASPLSASGQAKEEPTLQLQLDGDDVTMTTQAQERSRLEYYERRVQGARGGLIATAVITGLGGVCLGSGAAVMSSSSSGQLFSEGSGLAITGGFLAAAGGVGMLATGATLGARKRQARQAEQALRYQQRRRARWDVTRSALAF